MKFVIQCTTQASVTIDQKLYSEIGKGFLVLIGICDEDTKETADKMVRKLIGMRIFSDENGKTNLALKDVDGQLLLVPNLPCTRTAKKAIGRPLSKPDHHSMQTSFTNTSSTPAKRKFPSLKPAYSVRKWRLR